MQREEFIDKAMTFEESQPKIQNQENPKSTKNCLKKVVLVNDDGKIQECPENCDQNSKINPKYDATASWCSKKIYISKNVLVSDRLKTKK